VSLVRVFVRRAVRVALAGLAPPRLLTVRCRRAVFAAPESVGGVRVRALVVLAFSSWDLEHPRPRPHCAAAPRLAPPLAAGWSPPPVLALHQSRRIPNRRSGSIRGRVKPAHTGQPAEFHPPTILAVGF
jgi:hypothetical protein